LPEPRRPFDDERRPFDDDRRPFEERLLMEARRPFDEERRPFEDERRPFEDERLLDEERRPFDDELRPLLLLPFDPDRLLAERRPLSLRFGSEGTLPPARRASESPIAIACLRLLTVFPEPPLFSVPRFRSCMAFSTFSAAFLPYRGIWITFFLLVA
jgi:hypothetical protein